MHDAGQGASRETPGRGWLPLLLLLAATDITGSYETMMVVAAIPHLVRHFNDPIGVGWLMSGYFLANAASIAIIGRLGDLYGHKKLLIIILAITAFGSFLGAAGPTLHWVIAGRFIQGASGGILPLSLAILRHRLPPERMSMGVGTLLAASGVGAAVGLVSGGIIIDNGPWQNLFILSGALALVNLAAVWAYLPRSELKANGPKIDIIGGTLFVPAIAAILFAVSNIGAWGIGDMRFISTLLIGLALGVAWFVYELRHPDPLLNVRLFAQRDFLVLCGCIGILGLGGFQTAQVQMLYLQQPLWTATGLGFTATIAGLLKIPSNVASAVFSPLVGQSMNYVGSKRVVMFGFALAGAGWLLLMISRDSAWLVVATITLACNLGTAIVFVGASAGLLSTVPADRAGEAMGLFSVARSITMALGAQMVMVILASDTIRSPAGAGTYPTDQAYLTLFGALMLVSVIGICCAAFQSGGRQKPITEYA